jgi:hypothetical protein
MSYSLFDPAAFADAQDAPAPVPSVTRVRSVAPVPTSTVSSTETNRSFLTKPAAQWTWKDLQGYVVSKIEQMHGPFPRSTTREFGIFNSFAMRYGKDAGPIAVFAFETSSTPGRWKGAPINVGRFARGSDPYFADVILNQHLRQK